MYNFPLCLPNFLDGTTGSYLGFDFVVILILQLNIAPHTETDTGPHEGVMSQGGGMEARKARVWER